MTAIARVRCKVVNSARLLVPVDLVPRFQILDFPWWVGGRWQLTIVVQPGRITAQHLGAVLRPEVSQILRDELGCSRPDTGTVGVVVRPHKRVQAVIGEQLTADLITNERAVDLPVDVIAGPPGDVPLPAHTGTRWRKAHLVVVELLGEERYPTHAGLREYQAQAGVALQDPGGNDVAHGVHTLPLMAYRTIGHESTALRRRELPTAWARIDVHVDRHRQVLAGGPEALVVLRAVGQLCRWHKPDVRTPQARLAAALQLLHRMLNVPQRDHAQSPEALRGHTAKFNHPVVVGAATRFLELHIPHHPGDSSPRGVEYLGADAVVRLVLEPLVRVPTARSRAAAGGVVAIRKARGAVPERGGQPLLRQVRWLCHVRVSRNPLLAAYCVEGSLGHFDVTESWERHNGLHSIALYRPVPAASPSCCAP